MEELSTGFQNQEVVGLNPGLTSPPLSSRWCKTEPFGKNKTKTSKIKRGKNIFCLNFTNITNEVGFTWERKYLAAGFPKCNLVRDPHFQWKNSHLWRRQRLNLQFLNIVVPPPPPPISSPHKIVFHQIFYHTNCSSWQQAMLITSSATLHSHCPPVNTSSLAQRKDVYPAGSGHCPPPVWP